MRKVLWSWATLLLLGCTGLEASIVLEIDADPGLGGPIDHLCLVHRADSEAPQVLSYDAGELRANELALATLPQTLTFIDDRGRYDDLTVIAHARQLGVDTGAGFGRFRLARGEQTRARLEIRSCGPGGSGELLLERAATLPAFGGGADPQAIRRATLVDLDADGRAELVESDPLRVVDLDPQSPRDVTEELAPAAPQDTALALARDINRDCAADLVLTSASTAPAPLVSGAGGEPLFGPVGQGGLAWESGDAGGAVAAGDLDGDGDTDLFFAGDHIYRVLVASDNDGEQGFGPADGLIAESTHEAVGSTVLMADLDGVADPEDESRFSLEVVVGLAGNSSGTSSVRIFKGGGSSLDYLPMAIDAPSRDVASVSAASLRLLTHDDTPDLLVVFSSGTGPAAILYAHDEDPGLLSWEQGRLRPLADGEGVGGDLIDLDGDCVAEIVLAVRGAPILVYEQISDGVREIARLAPDPGVMVSGLATGVTDLDGDGQSEATLVMLQSDGGGQVYVAR